MLPKEVINHMDVDELRNHLIHVQRAENAHGDLMHAQTEIIDLLQRLYNAQNYKDEQRMKHDVAIGNMRRYELVMELKYKEFMPSPTFEWEDESGAF